MSKINILGTDYELVKQTVDENSKLRNADGLCEFWAKKIVYDEVKPDYMTYENISEYDKKVLRHEIIHAYFGESGLKEYMEDETLVDWLAVQFHKIEDTFRKLNI